MSVKRSETHREYRHGTRGESASRCIGEITKGCEIFGLTKGDFSMIDMLAHIVSEIGPCDVAIGTWTAGKADVRHADRLFRVGGIRSIRFLVDRSFPNRQPKYFSELLNRFGGDCVRLARFHAKFITMENDEFSIAVRTSMNLNKNMRIESYEISEGSKINDYLGKIVDHHFAVPMEDSYEVFKKLHFDKKSGLDFELGAI